MSTNARRPQPIRVMVIEDQGMFRAFLERWLADHPNYLLAGSAPDGAAALALLTTARPDVLIVDMHLPGMDGLACVAAARALLPHLRALILTSDHEELTLTRVRQSGVEGYLEKDAPPEVLTEALAAVVAGRGYFSPRFRETLARASAQADSLGKILTRREQQVLELILGGCSGRQAGEVLGLSERTVEFHRGNLLAKLGAANLAELLVIMRRRSLG